MFLRVLLVLFGLMFSVAICAAESPSRSKDGWALFPAKSVFLGDETPEIVLSVPKANTSQDAKSDPVRVGCSRYRSLTRAAIVDVGGIQVSDIEGEDVGELVELDLSSKDPIDHLVFDHVLFRYSLGRLSPRLTPHEGNQITCMVCMDMYCDKQLNVDLHITHISQWNNSVSIQHIPPMSAIRYIQIESQNSPAHQWKDYRMPLSFLTSPAALHIHSWDDHVSSLFVKWSEITLPVSMAIPAVIDFEMLWIIDPDKVLKLVIESRSAPGALRFFLSIFIIIFKKSSDSRTSSSVLLPHC
jgi:hypothetical protein